MSEKPIKIHVLIPVFNSQKYLEKCLNSILNQKYTNWEAIIINDASEDNTHYILEEFANLDDRFKVYHHEKNKGPGITRNEAIEYAIKNQEKEALNYIVFIDSDDWIDKNYFEYLVNTCKTDSPEVIFIDVMQVTETGQFIKIQKHSQYKDKSKETLINYQMTGKLPWGGVRKAVNLNLLEKYNIRYSDDAIGEEAIYSFKVLHNSKTIAFIDQPVYHYVVRSNSQSSTYDIDPYGKVCNKLKKTLYELKVYDRYKLSHISFAFTALIVSIYRSTQYYSFVNAYSYTKVALNKYKNDYGFKLNKDSLEQRVRFLLPLCKLNLVFIITVIAKLKSKYAKK